MTLPSVKPFAAVLAEIEPPPQTNSFERGLSQFAGAAIANASPASTRANALANALAWTESFETADEADSNAPPPPMATATMLETIISELGPIERLQPSQLRELRRRFLWKYHPDRQSELSREAAGRRVATANMLIDAALSAHRQRG